MQQAVLSSARRIDDPKAAAVFSDPFRRRILLLFIAREYAIAELAAAIGMDVRRLHYYVRSLAALGLIRVMRTRRRAGRAIRFYRASAVAFFVPAEIETAHPSLRLAREMDENLRAVRMLRDEGTLYDVDEEGRPRLRPVASSKEKGPAAFEIWRLLRLSQAAARDLERDLTAVLKRYEDGKGAGYMVRLALAPSQLPVRTSSRSYAASASSASWERTARAPLRRDSGDGQSRATTTF
jgi:hypothetical protein